MTWHLNGFVTNFQVVKEKSIDLYFARLLVIAGIVESRLKPQCRVSIRAYNLAGESFVSLVTLDGPAESKSYTHSPGIPETALADHTKIQSIARWVLKQIKTQCPQYFE